MSNIWCPAAAVRSVRNKSLSLANKGFIILAGCESHLVLLTHDLLSWQVSQLVLLIQDFLSSWQAHSEHKPLTILLFFKNFWPHQMNKKWIQESFQNIFFFSSSTPFLSTHSEWRSCRLWNGKSRDIDNIHQLEISKSQKRRNRPGDDPSRAGRCLTPPLLHERLFAPLHCFGCVRL